MAISSDIQLFSIKFLLPLFSLVFFLETTRVFISGIYYSNLATLSINITLLFLFILLLTLVAPVMFPKFHEGRVTIAIAAIIVVLRIAVNFSFPAVNVRPDPSPNLALEILLSGFCAVLSLILFARLLHIRRALSQGQDSLVRAHENAIVFLGAIAVDMIAIIVGGSLDLSVANSPIGILAAVAYVGTFVLFLVVALPALLSLKESPHSRQSAGNLDEKGVLGQGLSRRILAQLACLVGLVLFFELSFFGNPFVFSAWTGEDPFVSVGVYGLMISLSLVVLSFPWAKNFLSNRPVGAILNTAFLLFLIDVGFLHPYLSSASGRLGITPIIDLGMIHTILIGILAGLGQGALILDLFLVFHLSHRATWSDYQWIIGGSTPFLVLTILLIGFTYVYSVLPGFLEPIFKDLIVVYSLLFAVLVVMLSHRLALTKEAS